MRAHGQLTNAEVGTGNAEVGVIPHFRVPRSELRVPLTLLGLILAGGSGCAPTDLPPLSPSHRAALADTVLTLFDSVSAIHSAHPDTGILRRLHPPTDSLVFREGGVTEVFTGDSLFRRVLALHVPVRAMTQRFTERKALVPDVNTGIISAVEDVDWVDDRGPHRFHGVITLMVAREGGGWVVRAYIS